MQFNFTAPGGIAHVTVSDTHPDPERRFNVRISGNFQIGSAGLRDVAKFFSETADAAEGVKPKAKRKDADAPEA